MDHQINDNKYQPGTSIYAKANPQLKLVIDAYKQRIYYCAVEGSPEQRYVYFERELIDPGESQPQAVAALPVNTHEQNLSN